SGLERSAARDAGLRARRTAGRILGGPRRSGALRRRDREDAGGITAAIGGSLESKSSDAVAGRAGLAGLAVRGGTDLDAPGRARPAPGAARGRRGAPAAPAAVALALGTAAPLREVAMKNVDGKSVSIAAAAGPKGTLVVFICNHCPWVKAWQSRIAQVGNQA